MQNATLQTGISKPFSQQILFLMFLCGLLMVYFKVKLQPHFILLFSYNVHSSFYCAKIFFLMSIFISFGRNQGLRQFYRFANHQPT